MRHPVPDQEPVTCVIPGHHRSARELISDSIDVDAGGIYVVLGGSGRIKRDGELLDVGPLDAIRVAAATARAFEAGEDGLEFLAFGPHHPGDGEGVEDSWTDQ